MSEQACELCGRTELHLHRGREPYDQDTEDESRRRHPSQGCGPKEVREE